MDIHVPYVNHRPGRVRALSVGLLSILSLVLISIVILPVGCGLPPSNPAPGVHDQGVRGGEAGAGGPLAGLNADEREFFDDGLVKFLDIEAVPDGLGPRFNANQCAVCHSQPAIGGTSPAANPLPAIASLEGASNRVPWFIAPNGPIREARFKKNPDGTTDGGVHALFVISGRADAGSCAINQPDFTPAGDPHTGQGGNPNIVFRIPTPVFGAGLIEAIPDEEILANMYRDSAAKAELGVKGRPNAIISGTANLSANDGTITRFGWKAQNKSLLMFSGEAYNVEMGITNQLFPQERGSGPGCDSIPEPQDAVNFSASAKTDVPSDIEAFSIFMRLLAPPEPAGDTPSIVQGRSLFVSTGCASCHTPTLHTAKRVHSGSATVPSPALSNKAVNLYSDLLLHQMGERLADGIVQGGAGPDEFRTAPLWGVGQRVFFLHDGRTKDILEAIEAHRSRGSEASKVIERFNSLTAQEQQAVLSFLRSL